MQSCSQYVTDRHHFKTYLVDEIGYEENEGEDASDQSAVPDVGGLTTGGVADGGRSGRSPMPVRTLNYAVTIVISLWQMIVYEHIIIIMCTSDMCISSLPLHV